MSAQRPSGNADVRCFRFEHTVTAVALLSGFVFEAPWVIPIFAALSAATTVQGEEAPLPTLFHSLLSPRLRRPPTAEDTAPWRTAAGLSTLLLGTATLIWMVGNRALAWALALP
ncbi:MAG: DUF4395 family protein, partial [Acidimicrobiia bacterium]